MIAWLDCASGVSGDKLLAALLDAGAPEAGVREALSRLPLGRWELQTGRAERGGMAGVSVRVSAGEDRHHRTWRDIREMLGTAAMPARVRDTAMRAFSLLAAAEGDVHGVPADDVVFHEVGAVDSIVDIVGSAAAIDALGVEDLVCSTVSLGGGTVDCAHGTLPVPAPATARLLEGVPVRGGPAEHGELTTPTGAALLRALASGFGPMPPMTVASVGHGAGGREVPGVPNVLRVFLGEPVLDDAADEDVVLLETNVDHLAPELLAIALDGVLAAGSLDVWQTPVLMKKGRAAFAVSVMCAPCDEERLATLLMEQTGTLGVRRRVTRRWVAGRETAEVAGSLGRFRVKRGAGASRPEADDVARICRETGLPPVEVARRLGDESDHDAT